ncbi:MAG: response regulator transcription factor [Betaproteobacteria bacterium]
MSGAAQTVFVVEDDAAVRDSLALTLSLAGYRTALYADAEAFLAAWRKDLSGCVLSDLRLPGMSGVQLQAELRARGSELPFIVVTAHGDVATARQAFLADAVDFLEKPFGETQLMAAIETALARDSERQRRSAARRGDAERLASLTDREREVLEQAALGLHAKEIAARLGISPRTVEVHKTHIMAKLGVRNVAELVRFALAAETGSGGGRGG